MSVKFTSLALLVLLGAAAVAAEMPGSAGSRLNVGDKDARMVRP